MDYEKETENAERLAVVETELKQLNKNVNVMNDKLDIWNKTFVPRDEIDERFSARDKEIESIKNDIKFMRKVNMWAWGLAIPSFLTLATIIVKSIT